MTFPDALVSGVQAATGVDVVAHRRKESASADYIIVATERSDDGHLFGGGIGAEQGGESITRLALWYVIPSRVAEARRTPQRALAGLQVAYDYVAGLKEIGDHAVFVSGGLGPMLRPNEDDHLEVVAYARLTARVA